jgi:hypothetical protein
VNHDDRFDNIRHHARRRHHMDLAEFERDLDELQAAVRHETREAEARFELLQAEMAELLRRLPDPATTPVRVVVTVH